MNRHDRDLVSRFSAIVGDRNAVTEPGDQERHLVEPRGLWHGRTPVVLRPGSVGEVSAILKLANETGTAIVPQSGNTGLVGGQMPSESGTEVVLSLERLDRIRSVDAASNTMVAEAGVILADAQKAAGEADRLFPLSLASEGSCRIGGNLSTNAGGTAVLAYGNARDLVLGLEVVLADGRVWNGLRALRKDNTGYDLKHLFIGSEGTLGIITAAVLKLYPRPRETVTAICGVESPAAALELLGIARSFAGGQVTACEIVPRIGVEFVLRHGSNVRDPMAEAHPYYVLLEFSMMAPGASGREIMEAALVEAHGKGVVADAAIADFVQQSADFWRLRELLSEVQTHEGGSIKHDVPLPLAAVPEFFERAIAAVERVVPGSRVVGFGHIGDGNIHFNVSQPVGADKAAFLARWDEVNAAVHAIVRDLAGSVSAEHGIGVLKRHLMDEIKEPVELEMMRSIKATLDPKGILNPGKVV